MVFSFGADSVCVAGSAGTGRSDAMMLAAPSLRPWRRLICACPSSSGLSAFTFILNVSIFPFSQCETPPIIVDRDADVIRIVQGRGTAIEHRVIEVPLRRCDLPD